MRILVYFSQIEIVSQTNMDLQVLDPFWSTTNEEDSSWSQQGWISFKVRDEEDEYLWDFIFSFPLELMEILAYYILSLRRCKIRFLVSRVAVVRYGFITILQIHLIYIHTLQVLRYLWIWLSHLRLLAHLFLLPYTQW